MGAAAIQGGVNRVTAACLTLDFSLIGSSRMYYALLAGRGIHEDAATLYELVGWGQPAGDSHSVPDAGSHCVITEEGLQHLFGRLADTCRKCAPSRKARLAQLVEHHQHYTVYVVALLSFCLGLRPVHVYRLLAGDLIHGQRHLMMHDKLGGERRMAQPVYLNELLQEQIRQYLGHCRALLLRLTKIDSKQAQLIAAGLSQLLEGKGPLLFHIQRRGNLRPAGAWNVWNRFPEDMRVPANAGRHFWQNVLRAFRPDLKGHRPLHAASATRIGEQHQFSNRYAHSFVLAHRAGADASTAATGNWPAVRPAEGVK